MRSREHHKQSTQIAHRRTAERKKYDEIPTGDEQRHNALYPEKHSSRNSFGQSVVNSDTHSLGFQYDSE